MREVIAEFDSRRNTALGHLVDDAGIMETLENLGRRVWERQTINKEVPPIFHPIKFGKLAVTWSGHLLIEVLGLYGDGIGEAGRPAGED